MVNRGEDSELLNWLKVDGIKIYVLDFFNFIVWRGNVEVYIWDVIDEYFLFGE